MYYFIYINLPVGYVFDGMVITHDLNKSVQDTFFVYCKLCIYTHQVNTKYTI